MSLDLGSPQELSRPTVPFFRSLFLAACCTASPWQAASAQERHGRQSSEQPSDRAGDLAPIIVTAQRREETLQAAPVSVVALSADELQARSLTHLRGLQNFVPNLTFSPSQNVGETAGNVFIRGIGQEDFAAGAEPGVGFYVDEVYFGRTLGTLMSIVDLERIEVLRGPQGTLYGKNTVGGAIHLISHKPGPVPEGRIRATVGNFGRRELQGTINQPVVERLLLRFSLGLVSRDGYLKRRPPPLSLPDLAGVSGRSVDLRSEGAERSQAGRLQLRWLADERLTVLAAVDYSRKRATQGALHIDAIDPRFGILPDLNALIRQGLLPGPEITAALAPRDLLVSRATGGNLVDETMWGGSVTVERDLGQASLKFIGAVRGIDSRHETDSDGLHFRLTETHVRVIQRQVSGELQVAGRAGRLTYVTGLFGFAEWIRVRPPPVVFNEILYTCGCYYPSGGEPRFTLEYRDLTDATLAAYAQGTYDVTDRLSATLGGRYSWERKSLLGEALLLDAALQPTRTVAAAGSNAGEWASFTYRAGLQYRLLGDAMLYVSVAKGFKSGGFNARGALTLPNLGYAAFKPETARTYELGWRSEWLSRRLRLNATLFQTDYRDIQLRQLTLISGATATLIENAARARITGAELEVTVRPVADVTLGAAFGVLEARYLDVGRVPGLTRSSRFQRTPRHSFTLFGDAELPVRSGTVALHVDYAYRAKEQFQIIAAANDQPAFGLLGARISFRTRDEGWQLALFGTNLTDQRYRTAGRGTLLTQSGIAYSSVGLPRQLGLEVTRRF